MKTAVALLILSLAASVSIAAQQTSGGVRPLANIKELHDILITPASDAVFRAGGETPATVNAWRDARNQALLLAEAGNLLMLSGRARDNTRWMKMSRALVDAAAAASSAAGKQDANALASAGDAITRACEACHQPYRDGGRQMLGTSTAARQRP